MTAKNPLESVMPNVVAGAIEQVIDSQVATDKKVESLDEQIMSLFARLGRLEAAHADLQSLIANQGHRIPNVPALAGVGKAKAP